eukprot:840955_1
MSAMTSKGLQKRSYYKLWNDTVDSGQLLVSLENYVDLAQIFLKKYNDSGRFMDVYDWFMPQLRHMYWTQSDADYNCFRKIAQLYTQAVIDYNLTRQHVHKIWKDIQRYDVKYEKMNMMVNPLTVCEIYNDILRNVLAIYMDTCIFVSCTNELIDGKWPTIRQIILSKYFAIVNSLNNAHVQSLSVTVVSIHTLQYESGKLCIEMDISYQIFANVKGIRNEFNSVVGFWNSNDTN